MHPDRALVRNAQWLRNSPGGAVSELNVATFAGGCFWCLEAVFNDVRGVRQVVSGYMGGHVANPTYEAVCEKTTGHAEVVQLTFDPAQIAYRDLLEVFFSIHDPTTPNRQGNDVGPQYRSAIYWHDEAQRSMALEVIGELSRAHAYGAKIVTEVTAASTFWPAEDYHQRYYARVGDGNPYCSYVVAPKLKKFRVKFAQLLKG
jgi:peptide-methionine (S)-S-oxide reductase